MISVLIVEDDKSKRAKIVNAISAGDFKSEIHIVEAASVATAAANLEQSHFDLMILDVQLPKRDNESAHPENGAELLRQVQVRSTFHRPTHIVGLTGYGDVFDRYSQQFAEFNWTLLLYDNTSDGWQRRLSARLEYIRAGKEIEQNKDYQSDLGIVVALEDVELRAVLALDAGWERHRVAGDDTIYYTGQFKSKEKSLTVVAAAAIQMGMPASTALAVKMCSAFRPRYLAMTGIAAGVKGAFGDVMIADKAWDYGSGKNKLIEMDGGELSPKFEPAPTAIPLDPDLIAKIGAFRRNDQITRQIEARWTGDRAPEKLATHYGPIASGASVLENPSMVEAIKNQDRKLIGVEMEAYGIFLAARICPAPRPKAIVMKSISDFANPRKDDRWQFYAAFTSAQYLYEFSLAEL
ncbi:MAG: response regulator [Planctomycetes bacterium]|nr:response regulator [Planctomycetota bacterium]